jgi:MFS family permease
MVRGWVGRIGALEPALRALLLSNILAVTAGTVGHIALAWWVAEQGGGRDLALYAAVGAIGAFVFLPLLSPFGDRYCKRRMMTIGLAAQAVVALAQAAVVQSGSYSLPLLILLDQLTAATGALFLPASASIVAEMLPAERLTAGLGLQKSGQALGGLIGPTLGGGMLALAGSAAALWLYALLVGVAWALTLRIPSRPVVTAARSGWLADIRAGLAAKWHIRIERWWTLVSFLFAIFLLPGIGMLLPMKLQSLGLSGAWLGASEAALSAGMLVGALGVAPILVRRIGRFAVYTGAVAGMGLCFVLIGAARLPVLLPGAFMLCGLCISVTQLVGQTHRMLAIPPAFRARMTSVQFMVMQVAGTIGPALGGLGLGTLGVDTTYTLFGGAILLTGCGYALAPGYRAFISLPHELAKGYYGRMHPELFERS